MLGKAMICTQCGAKIEGDVCAYCGTRYESEKPKQPEQHVYVEDVIKWNVNVVAKKLDEKISAESLMVVVSEFKKDGVSPLDIGNGRTGYVLDANPNTAFEFNSCPFLSPSISYKSPYVVGEIGMLWGVIILSNPNNFSKEITLYGAQETDGDAEK